MNLGAQELTKAESIAGTVEQLKELDGKTISPREVSRWRSGETIPNDENQQRLRVLFGIPLAAWHRTILTRVEKQNPALAYREPRWLEEACSWLVFYGHPVAAEWLVRATVEQSGDKEELDRFDLLVTMRRAEVPGLHEKFQAVRDAERAYADAYDQGVSNAYRAATEDQQAHDSP